MKKIITSSLITLLSILLLQVAFIKYTSYSNLMDTISIIRETPKNNKKAGKSTSSKKQNEETAIENKNIFDKIQVSTVSTGFKATTLWMPAIEVKVKNISNQDLQEYIKLKAVFIDTDNNEQLGVKVRYISTSSEMFVNGTVKKELLMPGKGFRGSFIKLNLSVKLYLEDHFIKTYKIVNKEL